VRTYSFGYLGKRQEGFLFLKEFRIVRNLSLKGGKE